MHGGRDHREEPIRKNTHRARPTAEVAIVQKALVHHAAAIKLTAGTIAWYARPHAFSEKDEGPE